MLILRNGGRLDFWVSHAPMVASFIKAHFKELIQVQVAAPGQAAGITRGAVAAKRGKGVLIWDPTRGGMRMPHLHYAGEIYAMKDSQWGEFSKTAVSALVQRIGKAQRVSFDGVMKLSQAVPGI
jgi:predicted aldo/keto reductase-like oxidoreductase